MTHGTHVLKRQIAVTANLRDEQLRCLCLHCANNRNYWLNPARAKLNNLNFHSIEAVSRYRDPQLQVGENYILVNQFHGNVLLKPLVVRK